MYEVYAAGAAAAFTVDCLVYPLDTLKTRYQSKDFAQRYASSATTRKQLFRGLYQGIGSVILATLPAAGIFFATYESMKRTVPSALPNVPTPLVHSAASALAEMASCVVLAPAEVIKQNAQMIRTRAASPSPGSSSHHRHHHQSTSFKALQQLGGKGTTKRLFTGYTALVARNLPFTALQFPIFEHLRETLWAKRRWREGRGDGYEQGLLETAVINGGSAGSAGAFAAWITTPSDVVKTRMMLSAGEKRERERERGCEGLGAAEKGKAAEGIKGIKGRNNSLVVARQVYATSGVKGLFRGGLLRAAWTAVGSGLYLGTYEMSKVWLTRGRDEEGVTEGT